MIRIRYLCASSLGALVVAAAKEQREACRRAKKDNNKPQGEAHEKSARCALQGPYVLSGRKAQKKMAAPVHPAPPFGNLSG